jgi:hypothetical protein
MKKYMLVNLLDINFLGLANNINKKAISGLNMIASNQPNRQVATDYLSQAHDLAE